MNLKESTFKLSTPYVSLADKLFFLQTFVHPSANYTFNRNQIQLDIDIKNPTFEEKLLNRVGDYLKTGTISLGSIKLPNGMSKSDALTQLKNLIENINLRFNLYIKSNDSILADIESRLKSGQAKLNFEESGSMLEKEQLEIKVNNQQWQLFAPVQMNRKAYDKSVFEQLKQGIIFGKHPNFQPHHYQLQEIIDKSHFIRHINAYDVGLGKTSVALLTAQNNLNMGLRSRILFVVPNSTLSKWYKDAFVGSKRVSPVYDLALKSECLFVGLKNESVNPLYRKSIDDQLTQCFNPQYNKIFMTNETFERLKMRKETVDEYVKYLLDADIYLESFLCKESYSSKRYMNQLYQGGNKSKLDIYFEDLAVDLLVFDELHIYKNSKKLTNNINAKYLSITEPSNIGVDAQLKAWYVRSQNQAQDGILGLTATPFTNSPLEIYSMLSLVVGDKILNEAFNVDSSSDFMKNICLIETARDYSIDEIEREYNIFFGLTMLNVLRAVAHKIITFKSHDDVKNDTLANIPIPDKKEHTVNVRQSINQFKLITVYKRAYQVAKLYCSFKNQIEKSEDEKEIATLEAELAQIEQTPHFQNVVKPVMDINAEPVEVVASPFNFIRKMDRIILNDELDESAFVLYIPKSYQEKVEQAIETFNNKKITEERIRLTQHSRNALKQIKVKHISEDESLECPIVYVTAKVLNNDARSPIFDIYDWLAKEESIQTPHLANPTPFPDCLKVIVDSMDYQHQLTFFNLLKIPLDDIHFMLSPKEQAIIDKMAEENAKPRANNGKFAKQLILNDILGHHLKLRCSIAKALHLPLDKIVILTGQTNGKPIEIQHVQDQYNDGQYQIVIGNEKMEVGVDLQIGTQAIHHLTIGWTPDATEQRNGRGVRQGNTIDYVNVYHYQMLSTFDNHRAKLVSEKSNWIDVLKAKNGSDSVFIPALTPIQYEEMIALMGGDEKEFEDFQERVAQEKKQQEINFIRRQQNNLLQMISTQSILANNRNLESEIAHEQDYLIKHCFGKSVEELTSDNESVTRYRQMLYEAIITENAEHLPAHLAQQLKESL